MRRGGDSAKTEAWAAKREAQRERYGGEERGDSGKTEAWAAKGEAQRERYGGEERRESPARLDRRRQAAGRERPGRIRREEGRFRIFFSLTAESNGAERLTVFIY